MEHCRIYRSYHGLWCEGDVTATRCIEESTANGVCVRQPTSTELVDCVVRKNIEYGMYVFQGKCLLRGGVISENTMKGVYAWYDGKVTVAKAEGDGLPQTVCKGNADHDWCTAAGREGEGADGLPVAAFGPTGLPSGGPVFPGAVVHLGSVAGATPPPQLQLAPQPQQRMAPRRRSRRHRPRTRRLPLLPLRLLRRSRRS